MPSLRALAALLPLLLGLGAGPAPAAGGEAGVNATHIVIGQSAPLAGLPSVAEYGIQMSAGLQMAFAESNAAGSIQGRNLTLLTMDDGYDYVHALKNFPTLKNQSLLLAGVCGTAINTVLLPGILQAGIPSVGPWTGADVTRFPFHEEVINVRASYADEMVVHAMVLVQKLRVNRVACFYQNDAFGQSVLSSITAALNYVGLQLSVAASYSPTTPSIEPALSIIAGYPLPVQAVVMASVEEMNINFTRAFWQDNRTDPDCAFLLISVGVTSTFSQKVSRSYWPNLYFTQTVPPLDTPGLAVVSEFRNAADLYLSPGLSASPLSFEGYLIGRLVSQVLKGIPGPITRQAFLDQLYNTRLYDAGGLLAGLYSRNFSGCDRIVCGSSIGLRAVFPATLDPATGAMHYNASLGYYSYAVTKLSFPVTDIVRPLLFGQLLPLDDPVWGRVAEAIGQQLQSAFAVLNAAGGVDGRPVELVQRYYAGDAAASAAALADRYPLLALIGSVVPSSALLRSSAAQIGTYQTDPPAEYAAYNYSEVQVQASLPLELMALAAFAYKLGVPVHLRAPNTAAGQTALQAMVLSLHSLQQQPASSRTYTSAADALQGLGSGTVIAVGSDTDVAAWFSALADLSQLRLLVPSQRAVHLLATLNVADYPQASRFHYPYMFDPGAAQGSSGADVRDAVLYGKLLGGVLSAVLAKAGNASLAYTTTAQVLSTWYGSQYKFDGVALGPYYSTACSTTITDCDCNEGVRQVTVLTLARQAQPVLFSYALSTCRVAYADLLVYPAEGQWYIGVAVGTVAGVVVLGLVGWWLVRRGSRDNTTAPKDGVEPFCIIFTDIQSSTHLWATVPDVMATALHVHHALIRRLIARYKLYEIKTIGDSFMCATRSPSHAVDFALALQRALFEHDWGTKAIDLAYAAQLEALHGKWIYSPADWNGLRVRVGIHYGQGEVYLDPVSKGYDYYGTVVNTAARVEAVCHGGQIGITQAVYDALRGQFPGADLMDLGEHILRGLPEPVHLYQLLPLELTGRLFPLLRLEYCDSVDLDDHPEPNASAGAKPPLHRRTSRSRVAPAAGSSPVTGAPSPHSGPHSSDASAAKTALNVGVPNWVETHPMVRSGQLTAEDLTLRYLTVQKALTTLLETQTQRVRDTALRAFCERLNVPHCGTEGGRLEETLHGLVQRVLPAALSAVHNAGGSQPRRPSGASGGVSSVPAGDYYSIGPLSPASESRAAGRRTPPPQPPGRHTPPPSAYLVAEDV